MKTTTITLGNGSVLEVQHTPEFITKVSEWKGVERDDVSPRDIQIFIKSSFKIAMEQGALEKVEAI
jgi:hypothetical protein|tara:strand:- start:452 stop:649 length:198 start_codon:yes stop_codon:yes gene_type:complete